MIDEALLRPGRLEVQLEISLPDEHGRVQILNIHTAQIKENGKLGEDVDILELAQKTKNFSGAELAGLVRAAGSTAMNRYIKVDHWLNLRSYNSQCLLLSALCKCRDRERKCNCLGCASIEIERESITVWV